jgi:hypothetical protein
MSHQVVLQVQVDQLFFSLYLSFPTVHLQHIHFIGDINTFYPILSYPILSYPILSYPILSYPILSYPILPCPILSCPILSCPILHSLLSLHSLISTHYTLYTLYTLTILPHLPCFIYYFSYLAINIYGELSLGSIIVAWAKARSARSTSPYFAHPCSKLVHPIIFYTHQVSWWKK